jgi:hypothetical protein
LHLEPKADHLHRHLPSKLLRVFLMHSYLYP